jgi:MFS family permease
MTSRADTHEPSCVAPAAASIATWLLNVAVVVWAAALAATPPLLPMGPLGDVGVAGALLMALATGALAAFTSRRALARAGVAGTIALHVSVVGPVLWAVGMVDLSAGIIAGSVAHVLAAPGVAWLRRQLEGPAPGACVSCGYDLNGVPRQPAAPAALCPECGTVQPPARQTVTARIHAPPAPPAPPVPSAPRA